MSLLHEYREELRRSLNLRVARAAIEVDIAHLKASLKGCEAFFEGSYATYGFSPQATAESNLLATKCGLQELFFVLLGEDPLAALHKLREENQAHQILS